MPKRVPQTFCPSSLRHASKLFIRQVCGAPRTFLFRKFHINFKAIGILEWCCYWCEVNNVSLIGLIRIISWEHQSALKPLLRLLFSLPLQCKLLLNIMGCDRFRVFTILSLCFLVTISITIFNMQKIGCKVVERRLLLDKQYSPDKNAPHVS